MRAMIWAAAAALCATEASAETLQLAPYVEGTGLVTAEVEIAGRPAHVLFDTGAGATIVTPAFAQTIGCAPHGQVTGFRMRGDRLDLQKCGEYAIAAGRRSVRREVGMFDLTPLLGDGAPPIDGIVGVDVFDHRLITLSLAERRIYVDERPGRGWTEGVARFEREAGGAGLSVFVRAQARTGALWLLLDTGSVGTFAYLSPGALSQLGASEEAPVTLSISGAGEQRVQARRVDTLIYDGVLGEPFLRNFDIAVDFRNGRIWWRPHPAAQ